MHNTIMARYKEYNQSQGEFIVVRFHEQLIPGTFEHTLNYLLNEKIDISIFDLKYKNDKTGAPAYDPGVLLKIVLFAYSKGIFSSRKIMELCETNIIAKALSANTIPHYTVIADFISSMKDEVALVFLKILMVCSEMGLIGGNLFAVDGCKLPSNASKESSGTFKDLKRKKEKLEKLVNSLIQRHAVSDSKDDFPENELSGKNKTIDRINSKIQRIENFLDTQIPKQGTRGKEIQSNITDNESGRIKSSRGVIQGYNGIALADEKNQIIVATEAFGTGQEHGTFKPILEQAEKNLKALTNRKNPLKGKTILADTNYFCEENLKTAAEKMVEAIIPDQNFRKRDDRFTGRKEHTGTEYKFEINDFKYIKKDNSYICPNGKILKYIGHAKLYGNSGHRYQSKASDCKGCPFTQRCFHRKVSKRGRRTLYIIDNKGSVNYSKLMIEKIDRLEIRDLYARRMAVIEPVFANIICHKKLNRFTLRTKVKVNIQWLLYCMVHNIGKISNAMASA